MRTDDDSASVASSVAPTIPQPSPGWTLTPAQQVDIWSGNVLGIFAWSILGWLILGVLIILLWSIFSVLVFLILTGLPLNQPCCQALQLQLKTKHAELCRRIAQQQVAIMNEIVITIESIIY